MATNLKFRAAGSDNGLAGIWDAMPASEWGLDLKGRRPISSISQSIGKHLFE
ncbi:predicted protein [Botrytis cinerea T4]|uniref:Uncharacterized protein n=1 Tax=Botryotinia fuckeliana (strain T4) TaxID=999810 RepID=G2Y3E9_BOTF4|nr:predicted protein [Botrytis cinerea T4]